MTGKRRMRGEQIRGDTSAVGEWKCSCQDVLIVWTCGKSFLQSFLSLSATRGNKAPLLSFLSSGYYTPPHRRCGFGGGALPPVLAETLDRFVQSSLR